MDDCELDLVGLPARIENVGAGDGCDRAGGTGDALVNDGEPVAVGVGTEVLVPEGVVAAALTTGVGFDKVG